MHVYVSPPAARPDVRDFLRRADWVVSDRDGHHLEVELKNAIAATEARRELDRCLASWQVLHPGVETYVVEMYDVPARS
jgi:hypothetical protein